MGHVLDEVPHLGSEKDQFLSPMAALASALQSEGLHTDYGSLMCLGGGAYRACWSSHAPARSAVACSEDILASAAATQGFVAMTEMHDDVEAVWSKIVSSIDSGVPLLTCGLLNRAEWAVIVGFEEEPRKILLKGRQDASPEIVAKDLEVWEGWTYAGEGRMPLTTLRRVGKVVGDVDAFRAGLERAVRFAGEGRFAARDAAGREIIFASGTEAYSALAGDLHRAAGAAEMEKLADFAAGAILDMRAIADARRAATGCIEKFKRRGTRQIYDLTVAADRYAREIAALEEGMSLLAGPPRFRECAIAVERAREEEGKAVAALSRSLRQLH